MLPDASVPKDGIPASRLAIAIAIAIAIATAISIAGKATTGDPALRLLQTKRSLVLAVVVVGIDVEDALLGSREGPSASEHSQTELGQSDQVSPQDSEAK